MTAQVVVLLALRAFQLAEDRLLGLLRQFARHLLLGAPQNERPQRLRQQLARLLARIARQASRHLQHLRLAQHAGIQELEQAPQFAQVILHRRAAQRQPVVARATAAPPSRTRWSRS